MKSAPTTWFAQFGRRASQAGRRFALVLAMFGMFAMIQAAIGCKVIKPSNVRLWQPDQSRLSFVEIDGDQATVHNIRNANYVTEDDFILDYYDKTYDLNKIRTVDFIVVPFQNQPALAHTMLSFGFENGEQLALSVEIRKEVGEEYAAWKGSARQYELQYVLADERDVVRLRTNYRNDDVYLYRTIATPEQAKDLFLDVADRTNKLYTKPEFYDTVLNNCTNNLVRHVNRLNPKRIPYATGVLLPGYSDKLVYDLGLIETQGTFEETRRAAWISGKAKRSDTALDFSQQIRR